MTPRTLWTSGFDLERTGVGVIQRQIHGALQAAPEWRVQRGPDRPLDQRWWPQLRYKCAQLLARPRGADVGLVTATPRPVALSAPYVAIVYDARWVRTAGGLKRWYRMRELRATARGAAQILVISERTRRDLVSLIPEVAERVELLPIGPGQCSVDDFQEGEEGTVLLVGAAPHKRNRTMIEALAAARPSWCERLLCVNVAPADVQTAVAAFGADRVEARADLTPAEMAELFRRSQVYACLSVEEGFGIPFVEALCSGAQVLAVDQPLTRELLDGAAVLLRDGDVVQIAAQLDDVAWPDEATRRAHARSFSWEHTQGAVLQALREVTG